jgi:hypothetical protein
MTVDAIKDAIQRLPEPDKRELAEWLDEEFPLGASGRDVHEAIAIGLAQLDHGEGISGDMAQARLQKRKADWLAQRPPQ